MNKPLPGPLALAFPTPSSLPGLRSPVLSLPLHSLHRSFYKDAPKLCSTVPLLDLLAGLGLRDMDRRLRTLQTKITGKGRGIEANRP